MKRAVAVLGFAALIGAVGAVRGAPGAQPVSAGAVVHGEETTLAEGAGRDITIGRCILCHSLEYIPSNAPAMNRPAWQKTIQKMKERFGAPISDEESKTILDYLAAHYSGKAAT